MQPGLCAYLPRYHRSQPPTPKKAQNFQNSKFFKKLKLTCTYACPYWYHDPYPDWYGCSPRIYLRHGCSPWIYPPAHWLYTRITPFALFIYEDSNHINLGMGHGINTGTHMCICGSACHSCFLALTDTDNCFPLTASGGRSKKYHSIDSPAIKTGCTHIWPDSGYVHYLHGWVSVFV